MLKKILSFNFGLSAVPAPPEAVSAVPAAEGEGEEAAAAAAFEDTETTTAAGRAQDGFAAACGAARRGSCLGGDTRAGAGVDAEDESGNPEAVPDGDGVGSCCCWKQLQRDKAAVHELGLKVQHVDAAHLLAALHATYPPHFIQNEKEFVEPLYRYLVTKHIYVLLEQHAAAEKLTQPSEELLRTLQQHQVLGEEEEEAEEQQQQEEPRSPRRSASRVRRRCSNPSCCCCCPGASSPSAEQQLQNLKRQQVLHVPQEDSNGSSNSNCSDSTGSSTDCSDSSSNCNNNTRKSSSNSSSTSSDDSRRSSECSESEGKRKARCILRRFCTLDASGRCACDAYRLRPSYLLRHEIARRASAPGSAATAGRGANSAAAETAAAEHSAAAAGDNCSEGREHSAAEYQTEEKQQRREESDGEEGSAEKRESNEEKKVGTTCEHLFEGDPLLQKVLPGSLLEAALQQAVHPSAVGRKPGPWRTSVDEATLKVAVRDYEDNRELLTFRIEGFLLETSLLDSLSVLAETDLFKLWTPYFTTPFRIGLREANRQQLGRTEQLVHFHVDFPWPFANRDAFFEVWALDDLQRNGHIVAKATTLSEETPCVRRRITAPRPEQGVERMCVDGSIVIIPVKRNCTYARLVWHENCRMHVPARLVDFVSKIVARTSFNCFRRACQMSAKEEAYRARRMQNRFLYEFVERRLAELGLHDAAGEYAGEAEDGEVRQEKEAGPRSAAGDATGATGKTPAGGESSTGDTAAAVETELSRTGLNSLFQKDKKGDEDENGVFSCDTPTDEAQSSSNVSPFVWDPPHPSVAAAP